MPVKSVENRRYSLFIWNNRKYPKRRSAASKRECPEREQPALAGASFCLGSRHFHIVMERETGFDYSRREEQSLRGKRGLRGREGFTPATLLEGNRHPRQKETWSGRSRCESGRLSAWEERSEAGL